MNNCACVYSLRNDNTLYAALFVQFLELLSISECKTCQFLA